MVPTLHILMKGLALAPTPPGNFKTFGIILPDRKVFIYVAMFANSVIYGW